MDSLHHLSFRSQLPKRSWLFATAIAHCEGQRNTHEASHLCARAHPTRLPGMTVEEPRCSGAVGLRIPPSSPLSAVR